MTVSLNPELLDDGGGEWGGWHVASPKSDVPKCKIHPRFQRLNTQKGMETILLMIF